MRLRLRLTNDALRLPGAPARRLVLQPVLVTDTGDPLVTERGERLLAGPNP